MVQTVISLRLLTCFLVTILATQLRAEDVSFNRDIAPILAAKCYQCHGPDPEQRQAGLRLDDRSVAVSEQDSGTVAIVPGDGEQSELVRRLLSNDDDRMPPIDSKAVPLSDDEVWLVRKWIDEGAVYQQHWAFEPFIGQTSNLLDGANAIDAITANRLNKVGLSRTAEADRYTLIRRLYFDLIGLPPDPVAIQAFVNDQRPNAYQLLVESLLASPRYGERWGRHWLDVARYGDSNGGDENHAYPLAHKYRDYVIEAFNRDLPFDKFIVEQLAGDLLPTSDDEATNQRRLTATGYLAIGMKILAEQDPVKKRADIVDEQIDTVGRTFLGLSLGCARCHDHKFDPVPTSDYYALAGIFHSSGVEDRSLPSREYESRLASFESRTKELQTELDAMKLSDDGNATWTREAESFDRGNVVIDEDNYGKGIGIISDPGGQTNFAEYDFELPHPGEFAVQLRYAAEKARPGKLSINGEVQKEDAIAKTTGSWTPESQTWFMEGIFEFVEGKNTIRIESQPMMSHIDKLRLVSKEHLDQRKLKRFEAASLQLTELKKHEPKPAMVMAVRDADISDTKIHVRGSHLTLGDQVPRGFLEALDGKTTSISTTESGRLQLARWMTTNSTAQRLTSRVIANRVWHWHFGRGLVTTPDDFGIRGEPPTHPALLDHLAQTLIREKWSIKTLHRHIVASETYRMSSVATNAKATEVAPNNELLWKRDRVRLQAESLRDALLLQSGQLENRFSDAPMTVKSQDPSPQDHDANMKVYESSRRRSVYLPVVRSNVYEFFTLFDFPNASTPVGKRNKTTIPTQALWLMNSPFIEKMSKQIAAANATTDNDDRIEELHLRLYARPVTDRERDRAKAFLRKFGNKTDAWTAYCQVLIASNEYLYLK